MCPDVLCHFDSGIARITLNRPDALNAWTPDMGRELLAAVRGAAADPDVRVILLDGEGRAFSAGADVKNKRELTPSGSPDLSTRLRTIYNPIVLAVRAAPKPVVAAVHGAAAGLGASLALSCDFLLASESAYLLLAFVHIGVVPDAGALAFLTERVGSKRATQIAMLGRRLPAPGMLDWGLADSVHPDAELPAAATELTERLAAGPTVAYANIKRLVNHAGDAPLERQLEFEAEVQQEHATTADYAEGVAAFAEKRRPAFTGR